MVMMGRFEHHPDPVIDFCTEVDCIEGLVEDLRAFLVPRDEVERRIFRAMQFRVGGVVQAVSAKGRLRKAEADLKVAV